jgi:Protein of unknown function (DUF3231)
MNLFEVMKATFAPYFDGEKPPLTVAESFNLWHFCAGIDQILRICQVGYNTSHDKELKSKLHDAMHNVQMPIITELKEFLSKEGVPLPNSTPDKGVGGDFSNISEGALLNDDEIANLLAYKLYMGINLACRGLTEATRSDVGAMFAKFFMMKVTYSLTLRELMKKRGWLKVPPSFKP